MNIKNTCILFFLLNLLLVIFPKYGHSSYCSQEEVVKCLALVWGPDVCSLAFEDFAEKELDTKSYDTVTSPVCGKIIAEAIDEGFTDDDAAIAIATGLLDDLGSKSWKAGGFWGGLGAAITKGASFTIKLGLYESCVKKCRY
ncbi:MAG: hypothetical protein D3914_08790 [Candidatus Electrothrix sp. LOE2]|nr:hypothetical protein [Candidatus Electrothrix sp. LOE2]